MALFTIIVREVTDLTYQVEAANAAEAVALHEEAPGQAFAQDCLECNTLLVRDEQGVIDDTWNEGTTSLGTECVDCGDVSESCECWTREE